MPEQAECSEAVSERHKIIVRRFLNDASHRQENP
jgi:hypothetical protein